MAARRPARGQPAALLPQSPPRAGGGFSTDPGREIASGRLLPGPRIREHYKNRALPGPARRAIFAGRGFRGPTAETGRMISTQEEANAN